MFIKPKSCLGVGVNYRMEFAEDIIKNIAAVDFIEVGSERFFGNQSLPLKKITRSIPTVLHGLSLSCETSNEITFLNYLENLSMALDNINCVWFSEHIAATQVNDLEIRGLMPIEFSHSTVGKFVKHCKKIMSLTEKPFLLENIAYYFPMPNSSLNELNFINEIIEKADCGLLLDLNNLYVNSVNHHYDPYEFISQLPLERVVEIHLAGCNVIDNMLIDTHASAIKPEVLSLFEFVCQHATINGVIIERDDKLTNFQELIKEVELVRTLLYKHTHKDNIERVENAT